MGSAFSVSVDVLHDLVGRSFEEPWVFHALKAIRVVTDGAETELPCDTLILAPGHSARDTFEMLLAAGVPMEQKPFAIGLRAEHLQKNISAAQFGAFAEKLPPADYKLACHLPNGRSAYTFCVCPGGQVVAAASEAGRLVTNGMIFAETRPR